MQVSIEVFDAPTNGVKTGRPKSPCFIHGDSAPKLDLEKAFLSP